MINPEILAALLTRKDMQSEILNRVGPGMLELLRKALSPPDRATDPPSPAPTPTRRPDSHVRAALEYSYVFDSSYPETERDWLISNSSLVAHARMSMLRLDGEARALILDDPDERDRVAQYLKKRDSADLALETAAEADEEDLAGFYLRQMLRGRRIDVSALPGGRRRMLAKARRALAQMDSLPQAAPSLQECERQTALADLLDPIATMIGMQVHPDGSRSDRFAGRESDLAVLRRFVDVLGAETLLEGATRSFERFGASVADHFRSRLPRLLTISAAGGLGKSTLMAKFIFDHALSTQPFPFAYLDFDRAGLQPRSPEHLLSETAYQVSLQFPLFAPRLEAVRAKLRPGASVSTPVDSFWGCCEEMRGIIRDVLKSCGSATFLLTLDTLELVQSDLRSIGGVSKFLATLGQDSFGELCVVASGRAGIPEITNELSKFNIRDHPLLPLTYPDAISMVDKLGKALMGKAWEPSWAPRLSGRKSDPPPRREPLTLRFAVEMVRDAEPSRRPALAADLLKRGENASEDFVAVLYQQRTLDHIPEGPARKLAWPGLVVRTLTPQIATSVLAPLCELTPAEAAEGYKLLAAQVWVVQNRGDRLQHQRELRARTLPLMRRHDIERFAGVVNAMIRYYEGVGSALPEAPGEALYYRLLRGGEADIAWLARSPREAFENLAEARQDLVPGSSAWVLLEAFTARRPLALTHLKKLPEPLVWKHVARTGSSLRSLDERRAEPRVAYLMDLAHLPEIGAEGGEREPRVAWQSLQIKTGQWSRLDGEPLIPAGAAVDVATHAFYASRSSPYGLRLAETGQRIAEQRYTQGWEKSWEALAHLVAAARLFEDPIFDEIDRLAAESLRVRSVTRTSEIALRQLVMFGSASARAALPIWCHTERDRIHQGISLREFAIAVTLGEGPVEAENSLANQHLETARGFAEDIRDGRIDAIPPGAIADAESIGLANRILARAAEAPDGRAWAGMARLYCLAREPEWVVPFGYLAARRTAGDLWERMLRDTDGMRYDLDSTGLFGRLSWNLSLSGGAARHPPSDGIRLFDWADSAADIGAAVNMLAITVDRNYDRDFAILEKARAAWRAKASSLVQVMYVESS
jgi:hypothetical protein